MMVDSHSSAHNHNKEAHHDHEHTYGVIDPSLFTTSRGLWAVKWSFVGLMITALF
jgi:hypothetical protein